MTILRKLQTINISEEEITNPDAKALQVEVAQRLRTAAVENLRHGKGALANGFRNEYKAVAGIGDRDGIADEATYDIFLDKQIRSGVFGTYLEAASLGELLGCNVVVTPVKKTRGKEVESQKICLHHASPSAPTVHLYCVDNHHWYTIKKKPGRTLPDNNCLYNGFAQELKKLVMKEKRKSNKVERFFKDDQHEAVKHQQEILDAIQRKPSNEELMSNLEYHLNRESNLSQKEKLQIQKSYQAAFHLANEFLREDAGHGIADRVRHLLVGLD